MTGARRRAHGRAPFLLGAALLVASATMVHVLVPEPWSEGAGILVLGAIVLAGLSFGIAGALGAWMVAFLVYLLTHGGVEEHPAAAIVSLFTALTLGSILELRRTTIEQRAALAKSEERFRRLAQASFEGLVILEGTTIREANEVFATMVGVPVAQLRGADARQFLSGDAPEVAARFEASMEDTDGVRTIEVACRRADGSTLQAEVVSRVLETDGRPTRVVGVRDVTEKRKAEAVLRRNDRLSALGTLVAGVAHEINNPLTYIRGNLEMIELDLGEKAAEDPASGEIVQRVREALEGIERIEAITRSLKQVSRPAGATRASEDLSELAQGAVAVARARIPSHASVTLDLRAKRPVHVNASAISQVLLNLILNASDAIAESGSAITVRTRDEPARVVLEVEDDGPGIPVEKQAAIFTPFYTTKAKGTGLGLSISRSIAIDHGGELVFASSPGDGARFRLSLPAVPDAA